MLTIQPDKRRGLGPERQIITELLAQEPSAVFRCPWHESHKKIKEGIDFDLDHILPISAYAMNELWNLVPSDPVANQHVKGANLPSAKRFADKETKAAIQNTWQLYLSHEKARVRFNAEVRERFSTPKIFKANGEIDLEVLYSVVSNYVDVVATSLNLSRF